MTLKERWQKASANPMKINRKVVVAVLVVALVLIMVAPTFAQSTTTLDINPEDLQDGLFNGANVILGALATIMFLLAGFRFGGTILRLIVDTVTNFRF